MIKILGETMIKKIILKWLGIEVEQKSISLSTRPRGRRMLSEGVQPEKEKESEELKWRGFYYLSREEDSNGE